MPPFRQTIYKATSSARKLYWAIVSRRRRAVREKEIIKILHQQAATESTPSVAQQGDNNIDISSTRDCNVVLPEKQNIDPGNTATVSDCRRFLEPSSQLDMRQTDVAHTDVDVIQSIPCINLNATWRNMPSTEAENIAYTYEVASTFLEQNITHLQANAIFNFMIKHECLRFLPKDSRTLLETPREPIKLRKVAPGEYLHVRITCIDMCNFRLDSES